MELGLNKTPVLTVISLALADAGYQYNTPSASFGLPGNQPANFQTGSQQHSALPNDQDKLAHSVSYKDFVYLKNDIHQNRGGHQGFINHAAGNGGYAAPPVNNGYVNSGYPQSVAPVASGANLNSNSVQNFAPVGYNYNNGHSHNFAPISGSYANSYSQIPAPPSTNVNLGYQSNNHVVNSGYSSATSSGSTGSIPQPFPHSGSVGYNNGYPQASNGNALNSYSQASSSSSHAVSHGHSQTSLSLANSNSNSGYSHVLVPYSSSSSVNNNYAPNPLPIVGESVDTGYSQAFPPISNVNSNSNGYTQSASSSSGANYNSGYSYFPPNFSPSSAGSGNSHAQNSFTSAGSSFNGGYSQYNNINSGYTQSSSQNSQSLNNGYSQPIQSTIQHGQLNSDNGWKPLISQPSSSLNSGISQSSGALFNGNSNSLSQSSATIQAGVGSGIVNTGFTQTASANVVGSSSSDFSSAPITPTVYKHIYFHVPPPEIEEPKTTPPPPPPKKNYKIIFIKVPSQQSKSNLARLQQIAEMSNASVEHKTLIYVLVKNPETQQPVVLPKSTPSEHEVFFVKYNGDPLEIAEQVNKELDKTGTVQSIVPLEPGLVNGKK
ncbi:hypothetical protein HF086_017960 [Spodoptera exigua]|uniref:DUF243 domain-containing protein n=1 Tax=Spodoptera exigua TaxID=7107 RepID=A0A922M0S4_SPOEX|nr:hypothetical protein HF086_017960 [Spodoptera exigua]